MRNPKPLLEPRPNITPHPIPQPSPNLVLPIIRPRRRRHQIPPQLTDILKQRGPALRRLLHKPARRELARNHERDAHDPADSDPDLAGGVEQGKGLVESVGGVEDPGADPGEMRRGAAGEWDVGCFREAGCSRCVFYNEG